MSTPISTITIAEAAQRLRCNPRTIRRRIADGTLTGYRFGPTLIRLNPDEVDALLRPIPNAATVAPAPHAARPVVQRQRVGGAAA